MTLMTRTFADFEGIRQNDVLRVLQPGVTADLTLFLHALPGYWPVDVVADLKRLAVLTPECAGPASRLLSQLARATPDPDVGDEVRRVLPVPHPLDADWRFTVRTRERLLDIASSLSPRRETLLLGTPSIFAHMCSQLDLRAAVLIDGNRATVDAANRLASDHALLRAQHADLLAGVKIGLKPVFDTVIADPPWYFAEHRSFLDAASALLVPGGLVLMAAAPRGTRPSAEDDRVELVVHAIDAGFDLVDTLAGELEYTSSPFERAALRESGLPSVPTNWRRADLLTFKKSRRTPVDATIDSRRPSGWIDRASGRNRLKLHRGTAPTSTDSDHFAGTVSSSVSRLAPERRSANLWTSGNGAFNVCGDLIGALVEGDPRWHDSESGKALMRHLEIERADLRDWGWL